MSVHRIWNSESIKLELPYPPSVNTYWRSNGKRRFISKAGVEFTKEVDFVVKQGKYPSFGPNKVAMSIMIHPRSKRKFDLDNTLKAILDALMKAGVYNDDSQVDYIEIAKGEQVDKGKAVVHLYNCI